MKYLSESIKQTFKIASIFLITGLIVPSVSAQSSSDTTTYVVNGGDYLTEIAAKYGTVSYWKPILEANQNKITDPDEIYPGQILTIPSSVTSSEELANPTDQENSTSHNDQENENNSDKELNQSTADEKEDSSKTIKKFREAFKKVVTQNEEEKERVNEEEKNDPKNLEFGGLVLNKTTSRMGRDFFKAFNDKWQNPEEVGNFMLEISEQPVPSMGTMVIIKIGNQIVFKARLQPRQDAIQEKVQQSMIKCYRYLQQQLSSSSEPKIY